MRMQSPIAEQVVFVDKVKRKRKNDSWLLLLPGLLFFIIFFILPLWSLFLNSFHPFDQSKGTLPSWTIDNYSKFLKDSFYLSILWRTVKVGIITTIVSLILGFPVAYHLVQTTGRKKNYLTLLLLSPMLISMVIRCYGWVILLANNGVINEALQGLGWIGAPLKLLYTERAVEIGMIHVLFPYMVLSIAGSLERIDPSIIRASQNLGAGALRTFLSIILPLSLPGVFAGSVMVFSLATSSFVTPSILGGPQVKLMSYLTYEQVAVLLNWPYGGAVGFILIFMTTLTLLIYSGLLKRTKRGVVIQ
jgi:putative spermidine/putrescine transport system permease protein